MKTRKDFKPEGRDNVMELYSDVAARLEALEPGQAAAVRPWEIQDHALRDILQRMRRASGWRQVLELEVQGFPSVARFMVTRKA